MNNGKENNSVSGLEEELTIENPQNGKPADIKAEKSSKKVKKVSYKKLAKQLEKENNELKERLLRVAAEFENFRKRTERDYINIRKQAKEEIILPMIPFLDDIERSLNAVAENENSEAFISGVKMISDKFVKTLEGFGVKPFISVGEPFDVDKHEALLSMENKDVESNTVIDQHEKGYLMYDKVIRHAKVIVSK